MGENPDSKNIVYGKPSPASINRIYERKTFVQDLVAFFVKCNYLTFHTTVGFDREASLSWW